MIWRSRLRDCTIGVIVTLALFAGVELALRGLVSPLGYRIMAQDLYSDAGFDTAAPEMFRLDKDLLWTYRPALRHSGFATDAQGHRMEGVPAGGVDSSDLLLSLGDSCTAALESPSSYGKELADLVQRSRGGRAPAYLNAGTSGYSSEQGLRQLKRLLAAGVRPRWALLHFGHNDASFAMAGIPDRRLNLALLSTFKLRRHLARSYLAVSLYQGLIRTFPAARADGAGLHSRVSPEEFKENLIQMARTLKAVDAQVIMLSSVKFEAGPGHPLERHSKTGLEVLRAYNEAMRTAAAETDSRYLDLQPLARRLGGDGFFHDPEHDDVHPGAQGHKEIASEILPLLRL